ncbi:hypothetical protein [Amycolatopsis benzoatilytica]|uniref:hypothetical protein n=1 Tax=Amycolatopsis benzoatilytica TaxID=346045 RepID=UPI000367F7B7|nr:hypothetical protein [Amycolatopsis benzoatilytica]
MLINPGGPGGTTLRERFDLVGFDPRGVWLSGPHIVGDPAKRYDPKVSSFPTTRAQYDAYVGHNRGCCSLASTTATPGCSTPNVPGSRRRSVW